jgi:hypothetical protein
MFLFPLVYIFSFAYAIRLLLKKQIKGVLFFIITGLPIYIHVLSVTYMYGFEKVVPVLQSFKEICIILGLGMVLWDMNKRPKFHKVDQLIGLFFIVSFIYLIIPIGPYSFTDRLLAYKALSIFPIIYFTGRFCKAETINLNEIFSYVSLVCIIAAIVVLIEFITYQHIHTKTGFTDFMIRFYNGEISGNYGLIWTFETETGLKRFGSILSSPLELASAAVLGLSVVLALATNKKYKLDLSNFNVIGFLATLICVTFAVSRASFANYFIVIYFFGHITHNKKLVTCFHVFFIIVVIYIALFLKGDMFDFIIATLNFQNASSIGHVIEWVNGINGMIAHPFGMGLGTSGKIAMVTDDQVGGENQLIIIGVQVGVPVLIMYIWAYGAMITSGLKALKTATGKKKKLILCVVLFKIGLIIPLFTSYLDIFIYITYTTYFLSGLMINMIVNDNKAYQPRLSSQLL